LSVEAVQERLIWLEDVDVAVKLVGAVGGVVSFDGVLAVTTLEKPLRFPEPSNA
jgi:hypothetical protein